MPIDKARLLQPVNTIDDLKRLARDHGSYFFENGWQWRPTATDTAFAPPFGTIRQCRGCGCLVAGGPTECARCAEAGA